MPAVYLLVAVLGAVIALFAIQNNRPVEIHFLAWRIEGALSLVVLLSLLAGIVLTSILGLVSHWRLRAKIRQLENRLAKVPTTDLPAPVETPRAPEKASLDR